MPPLLWTAGLCFALWAPARPARACGGLVCNGAAPVDQANERVLFVVEETPDGARALTVVIQIQYAGAPEDFAWVLPVPSPPDELEVGDPAFFAALEAATTPIFRFDGAGAPGAAGGRWGSGSTSGGCGRRPLVSLAEGDPSGTAAETWPGGDVDVWAAGVAGPYDFALLSSGDTAALSEWLVRHGYSIPSDFATAADDYVREGYAFLVARLQGSAGVDAIAPLVLRYREPAPCIPLRMTAIAAVPVMGVRVWVVAPARAVPVNWAMVSPEWSRFFEAGGYDALVEDAVTATGGKGWVTEYAAPAAELLDDRPFADPLLADLLSRGPYLTRMFTRVARAEMTSDPMFTLDPDAPDVDALRVVPARAAAPRGVPSSRAALAVAFAAALGLGVARSGGAVARRRPTSPR